MRWQSRGKYEHGGPRAKNANKQMLDKTETKRVEKEHDKLR